MTYYENQLCVSWKDKKYLSEGVVCIHVLVLITVDDESSCNNHRKKCQLEKNILKQEKGSNKSVSTYEYFSAQENKTLLTKQDL